MKKIIYTVLTVGVLLVSFFVLSMSFNHGRFIYNNYKSTELSEECITLTAYYNLSVSHFDKVNIAKAKKESKNLIKRIKTYDPTLKTFSKQEISWINEVEAIGK